MQHSISKGYIHTKRKKAKNQSISQGQLLRIIQTQSLQHSTLAVIGVLLYVMQLITQLIYVSDSYSQVRAGKPEGL